MQDEDQHAIRRGTPEDAAAIGTLLDRFNAEFGEPTPGARWLTERARELLMHDDVRVVLAGTPPVGLAVLRFRAAIWSAGLECCLAELYVVPERRGRGHGRALLEAVIELAREHGADRIELGTGEDDVAARRLYESVGFDNRGGRPEGPVNFFYEREL